MSCRWVGELQVGEMIQAPMLIPAPTHPVFPSHVSRHLLRMGEEAASLKL